MLLRVCLRRALMVWSRAETSAMPVTSKILVILPLFYQNFCKSQDLDFSESGSSRVEYTKISMQF